MSQYHCSAATEQLQVFHYYPQGRTTYKLLIGLAYTKNRVNLQTSVGTAPAYRDYFREDTVQQLFLTKLQSCDDIIIINKSLGVY